MELSFLSTLGLCFGTLRDSCDVQRLDEVVNALGVHEGMYSPLASLWRELV